MTIALIDYGAGNLTSVAKALRAVGAEVRLVRSPEALGDAAGLVVPGVGHFQATARLDAGWREAIRAHVADGRPLLGICLGLQWLFDGSAEAPAVAGLGLLSGRCTHLAGPVKVPHVGWNALARVRPSWLLAGVPDGAQVYFTHQYAAPVTSECVATAEHGLRFAAAVERGAVAGVQFHPETSGPVGLAILENFVRAVETPDRLSRRP